MKHSLCPLSEPLSVCDGVYCNAEEILDRMGSVLTEDRRRRIDSVIADRTYSVVPVLEGVYDRGNVNAVLRSAEGMGYQAFHIVDTSSKFRRAKRVTQGAEKWLDITTWESPEACADHLKRMGYRLLVTCFENATPIGTVDFTQPTALVFGNERDGISQEMAAQADGRVVVPMSGFIQSFNISVAAALCLYHAAQDRIRRLGRQGDLDEAERRLLTASYYLRCIADPEGVLRRNDRTKQE